jgi:hypothetical protein
MSTVSQKKMAFSKVLFVYHKIVVRGVNGYSANIVGEQPTLNLLHLIVVDAKLTGRVMALIRK